MPKIEPRTLKGFRDFLPEQQITRQKFMGIIRASYETFGFEPLETPALEYAEILTGKYGDEGDKLMYRFKDNGDRDVALRYDLTIPLARVAAQYENDLRKPWKRYQISPVWRAENSQKGRYREFYQCDADIVGSTSPLADAEILALSAGTLVRLGIPASNFVVRVNSREIITAFYETLGFTAEQQVSAMRAVDKIDKIGPEGVTEELVRFGFLADDVMAIINFASIRIAKLDDVPGAIATFPEVAGALGKLSDIIRSALLLAPTTSFIIDFSIARGLDYYTGIIFETNLLKAPQFGAICAGGRYDNLIGTFSNRPIPAVGASIGLDRLLAALEELGITKAEKTTAQALIVNFDESLAPEYLKMASELRNAGVNTILYFDTADLKKQLSYASDKGIKFALMYGTNEAKEGIVVIKDLEKGTQEKVKIDEVVKTLCQPRN
ncbi:MAG: histidine--tRNA ligase [Candidatus Paceibacterota bacterium]|jgi:histidyl-tRNA synthetase